MLFRSGPGAFPLLIGVGLSLCGTVLIWGGWVQRGGPRLDAEETPASPRLAFNGVLVVGALVFYALAAETVGFFLAGSVFLASLFLAFGVNRRWIAPLAVAVTLGIHVAFYTLLRVPLPWGWFEGMAW